ncbi:MAG: FAD-dependent oxidoreductase, partial [Candidatus Methanomethylophilaceae archaeon]|nr:FAD-dependent oxidoreductase [Candidatus Methanomethylophilaceae archaeon]
CNFYKGKTVVIVGDETEAAVSAELMTRYASKVYWVVGDIAASENVVRKARDAGVEMVDGKVESITGEAKVTKVVVSGREIPTDGVFIELGAKSAADLAMDMDVMPEMDDSIKVDVNCATEVRGVFACGDITGKPWQVAKAVGQGAVAGIAAADYVKG